MRGASREAAPWWVAGPALGLLAGAALQMQQAALWPAGWWRALAAGGCALALLALGLRRRATPLALVAA